MDLVIALFFAFAVGPLGVFLIILAAIALRSSRPRRAKAVLTLSTLMALALAAVLYLDPMIGDPLRQYAKWIELGALAGLGLFVVMSVVLLIPVPTQHGRAATFGYLGLCCMAAGGVAIYLIGQTNFSF